MTIHEFEEKIKVIEKKLTGDKRKARGWWQEKRLEEDAAAKEAGLVRDFVDGVTSFRDIIPRLYAPENKFAHIFARHLKNSMKINQLRRFFGQLKQLEIRCKGIEKKKKIQEVTDLEEEKDLAGSDRRRRWSERRPQWLLHDASRDLRTVLPHILRLR